MPEDHALPAGAIFLSKPAGNGDLLQGAALSCQRVEPQQRRVRLAVLLVLCQVFVGKAFP
ncbi:hypothetical protein [Sphingobium sp. YR768]|uniref:hypothetical protein n=1 Tax=Sphingobium sp. YR768 TaxID=1884365 RepID=UPI0008C5402C|nr:hypothetical protein [Sphingobium sp. YR768]SER00601.1 hypothetical protein SAMN05518866_10481 [Sphingobium sp. YR768]